MWMEMMTAIMAVAEDQTGPTPAFFGSETLHLWAGPKHQQMTSSEASKHSNSGVRNLLI